MLGLTANAYPANLHAKPRRRTTSGIQPGPRVLLVFDQQEEIQMKKKIFFVCIGVAALVALSSVAFLPVAHPTSNHHTYLLFNYVTNESLGQ